MGMVPWILRDSVQAEPASSNWSPESLLSVLARPGSSASESALKGRAILILESEPWDLSKEEEQLLMAMLRSIGLAQNDLCRTTMASGTNEAGQHLVSLSQLLKQLPRAVFLLSHQLGSSASSEAHELMSDSAVQGWRLPHPALLIREPERKRQAWEVLKAARQSLSCG